jgi:hypothetical protein
LPPSRGGDGFATVPAKGDDSSRLAQASSASTKNRVQQRPNSLSTKTRTASAAPVSAIRGKRCLCPKVGAAKSVTPTIRVAAALCPTASRMLGTGPRCFGIPTKAEAPKAGVVRHGRRKRLHPDAGLPVRAILADETPAREGGRRGLMDMADTSWPGVGELQWGPRAPLGARSGWRRHVCPSRSSCKIPPQGGPHAGRRLLR